VQTHDPEKTTMIRTLTAVALLAVALPAYALVAILIAQRYGTSVTGQSILICTYSAAGTTFERLYPMGSICPPSVDVQ
jgi:hypothetical protein